MFFVSVDAPKLASKKETKDIWESDEVQPGSEFNDDLDPRPQPEYAWSASFLTFTIMIRRICLKVMKLGETEDVDELSYKLQL